MLLEEAAVKLLSESGYVVVDQPDGGQTISPGPSGLEVHGRGCKHQIDAIADFLICPPFSYPQRLLLEAKCLSKNVGIDIVRNSVGVLKDVNEYWIPGRLVQDTDIQGRYHYQYAILSFNDFSPRAQDYAYAHDVFLIPLKRSAFMSEVRLAIDNVNSHSFNASPNKNIGIRLEDLRSRIREILKDGSYIRDSLQGLDLPDSAVDALGDFINACLNTGPAIIAMTNIGLPLFLVLNSDLEISQVPDTIEVKIRAYRGKWYILRSPDDTELFSFDMPDELLLRYAENGGMSASRLLDLKENHFSQFIAYSRNVGRHAESAGNEYTLRLITFLIDKDWLNKARNSIKRK